MRRLILAPVFLLLAASCSDGNVVETKTLTDADTGSQVMIDTGDVIDIRLPSNPSTGYRWVFDPNVIPDNVALQSGEYLEPAGDLVGAAGTQVFTFVATGEGAGIIRFEYVRPFEEFPIPDRVTEYIVRVDGAAWPPAPGPPPATATATAPVVEADIDVADLADMPPGEVAVRGYVVWDDASARVCEVLMESYPPQCGGASFEIVNPAALVIAWEMAEGVQWSADLVLVRGSFDGARLTVDG